jgi:hypothetical protein
MSDDNFEDENHDGGRFTSDDCPLLEIREEDTMPGKRSESYTKLLEQKYGRKAPPPPDGPATGAV